MISVCIPCFEQYGAGLTSITALLDSLKMQMGEFEVIISDNSKDDNIKRLVEEKYSFFNGIYVKNNKSFGVSANTNNAISYARNDKIKIMYQDDVLFAPNTLKIFSEALNKKEWVVSESLSINTEGRAYFHHKPFWNHKILMGENFIGMPSVIAFRKNTFTFDINLQTLLDCEYYWLLYQQYGEPEWIRQALVGQRYWDKSTSVVCQNRKKEEYQYLIKKHHIS